MPNKYADRRPVSVVCVSNDSDVLAACLQRSVDEGMTAAPRTELIVVDNRDGRFSTAGAALNAGVRTARNGVIALVHQDVVLHSLPALERGAALLEQSSSIGMLGAVGIDDSGRILGRMRDRVVQIGEPADAPTAVASLDEVVLMATRDRLLRSPLTEHPLLAWHAYGVEYACRVRREGLIAAAVDLEVSHNSLTTNLARLAEAHHRIRDEYPELLPIRTTCGTITAASGASLRRHLARRHRAMTWWHESQVASNLARHGVPVVLADIRLVVDDAVRLAGRRRLTVVDTEQGTSPGERAELNRFGVPFAIEHAHESQPLTERLAAIGADEALLFTGLDSARVVALMKSDDDHVAGYWRDTGLWVLAGVGRAADSLWNGRRNRAYGGLLRPEPAASAS